MVTDPRWIPSAALTLAAFTCFALAFARLSRAVSGVAPAFRWGAITSAAVAVG